MKTTSKNEDDLKRNEVIKNKDDLFSSFVRLVLQNNKLSKIHGLRIEKAKFAYHAKTPARFTQWECV